MTAILTFLELHSVSIAIVVSLFGGLFKFWQYIDIKRSELKQKRFENYHKLIERLVSPIPNSEQMSLDIQKAIVFELRNYPEYKKVTQDILGGWLEMAPKLKELIRETLETL